MQWRLSCSLPPLQTLLPSPIQLPLKCFVPPLGRAGLRPAPHGTGPDGCLPELDMFPPVAMSCVYGICAFVLRCFFFFFFFFFFSVLRLYSKWSIVWGLKNFFSSSLSSCKKLYFLNTLSPVLSTPLSYVCCVCMDRLMANFAGTCTSDNKGLLLLLISLLKFKDHSLIILQNLFSFSLSCAHICMNRSTKCSVTPT